MKKLYILDASAYLYRSYFAIRNMTNPKGESTNALFGFIRCVLKLIKDFQPTHIVSVFDGPGNATSRKNLYAEYKAHRKAIPEDLLYQIGWAQEFCRLAGIPELMIPGIEADDTIGSIAQWASNEGAVAYLCTGDKDMCQLVSDKIFILNTFKENLVLDSNGVFEQFGVHPNQIIDYLSIVGDASDNVPGLTGFGPKTAVELLKRFGTLDEILNNPLEVTGKKKQETLIQEREKVLLSRLLVTIDTTIAFPKECDFFKLGKAEQIALHAFYLTMNFSSFLRELQIEPSPKETFILKEEDISYRLVDNLEELQELVKILGQYRQICVDTETTSIDPMRAELVGIGLGVEPKKSWYIPVNGQLGLEAVVTTLRPLFENASIGFYGHHVKYDYHVLLNYDITISAICFDTMLASYVLNSHSRQHSLDHLSLELFGKTKIPIQELIGKGKNQISMRQVSIDKVCHYCCEDVDYTIRLKEILESQIEKRGLSALFYNIELPLLKVLAGMERRGIYVDTGYLQQLSVELGKEIEAVSNDIFNMAGETFNLNSPKQLSHVLFEKLRIPPPKKTATGLSTDADVLDILKGRYPIAAKLLHYRSLEKLRSTYVETLPKDVHPLTHRIHCTFNQSMTATGRLSCQDPNLQNIPVRTEIGRKIREAFKPQQPGWSYLAADYSQIELRLLAHLSEDPILMAAFQVNEDIHAFTASQIFNVPLEEVTKEQRDQAKTVNFAIMYGQQAFGLSQELGIDPKTAGKFIQMYFERYHKVKKFLDQSKEETRLSGKAITLLGRERLIPEITSSNGTVRMMAERLAINTPIQGTQADLIKMAMLEIDRKLKEKGCQGYMILQIHDELLFEIPDGELEKVQELVHDTMTKIMTLKVPLVVDINIGKNWKEC
ncbi:MAG: DNA polymerase I [Parachlamydiaceae bacterium]